MKGLELSEKYFEECGKPVLENEFSDLLPYLATGFAGQGSDRYGYDDDISKDHDFEPGFCIFIPGENVLASKDEFRLERAYAKLPKEFAGVMRQRLSPVGGNRNGVIRTSDFYGHYIGRCDEKLTPMQWLKLPDYALAEATNGKIFLDNYGEFSRIRNALINMPQDIRLKRLAGSLLIMAQAGQYNYQRCIKHKEFEAAQLSCGEFINAAMKVVFGLRNRYVPYYKWSFKALKELENAQDYYESLSALLSGDITDSDVCEAKYYIIEDVASHIITELQDAGITKAICGDLEKHAYSVNDMIKDSDIRNMHIMTAV